MSLPPIDSLRCFVEAASTANFAVAARAVHLTPAALGQRIKQLEALVGEALFERSRRGVTLTARGAELLPLATTTLAAAQRCVAPRQQSALAGEVHIGVRYDLATSWLLPQVPALSTRHPLLNLHFTLGSGTDLMFRLRLGELDCAVSSARLTDSKLEALNLHQERFVFVASTALLRRTPFRTVADAVHHRLCDIAADLPLFRYFRDAGESLESLHFKAISYFGTIAGVHEVVRRGHGLGVLPLDLVHKDLQMKRLKRVLPSVQPRSGQLRLLFRMNDPRRPLFEQLHRELMAKGRSKA